MCARTKKIKYLVGFAHAKLCTRDCKNHRMRSGLRFFHPVAANSHFWFFVTICKRFVFLLTFYLCCCCPYDFPTVLLVSVLMLLSSTSVHLSIVITHPLSTDSLSIGSICVFDVLLFVNSSQIREQHAATTILYSLCTVVVVAVSHITLLPFDRFVF